MRVLLRTQAQNLQVVKRVDGSLDVPRIGPDLLARAPQPVGGSGELDPEASANTRAASTKMRAPRFLRSRVPSLPGLSDTWNARIKPSGGSVCSAFCTIRRRNSLLSWVRASSQSRRRSASVLRHTAVGKSKKMFAFSSRSGVGSLIQDGELVAPL